MQEVREAPHQRDGKVLPTMGYSLDTCTMGGGILYFTPENLVSLDLINGLDCQDPFL